MGLDDKDRRLIEMLMENARTPYTELAERLGISDVAVINRVRKLERMGLIKRYTILVDPGKLGYKAVSYTGVDVEPEHLFDIIASLKDKGYVRMLAITSGDHSIMALIWASNGEELAKIHDEISRMPGVKRVCPAIILEMVKE